MKKTTITTTMVLGGINTIALGFVLLHSPALGIVWSGACVLIWGLIRCVDEDTEKGRS